MNASPDTTAPSGAKAAGHTRLHQSLLAAPEKRALVWMAERLPAWVNSDHLSALGLLFTLAIGGLAMLLSAMFRDSGKPSAIASGLLLGFWIADMVANVSEAAEFLKPVNLVSYWQPGRIINAGAGLIPWKDALSPDAWWVYAGVAVATLLGSVFVFSRRDVA